MLRVFLIIALPWQVARAADTASPAATAKAHLLLVAPDPSVRQVGDLESFLERHFPVTVSTASATDYASGIDERSHDGFVYFGDSYFASPKQGFLNDMALTEKPVIWFNYHGWMLAPEVMRRRGLVFRDYHGRAFTHADRERTLGIAPSDTSWVTAAHPARNLYWIYTEDGARSQPGSVVSGNFAFIAHIPEFFDDRPVFPGLRTTVSAALAHLPAHRSFKVSQSGRDVGASRDGFRTGIHLPFPYWEVGENAATYGSDKMHPALIRIRDSQADWVTIHRTVFQDGTDASSVYAAPGRTASSAELRNIVEDAHALGLNVRLSFILNLNEELRKPGEWRGMIRPEDSTAWWQSYRRLMLETAELAAALGIDGITVGTELNLMQQETAEWTRLIRNIRETTGYRGLIGYQANFDAIDGMAWAGELDYLSIAAYWPLSDGREPALEDLHASWRRVGRRLDDWRERHPGVEIEFGEVGYTSQPYATLYPFSWKAHRQGQQHLGEQLNAYLSLERFLRDRPEIRGIFLYASTTEDLDPDSIGYTPFGKSAEMVLRRIMTLR